LRGTMFADSVAARGRAEESWWDIKSNRRPCFMSSHSKTRMSP